jgi:hypothetical protein
MSSCAVCCCICSPRASLIVANSASYVATTEREWAQVADAQGSRSISATIEWDRIAPITHRFAWAWMLGLRHNSRHKTPSASQSEPIRLLSPSRESREFFPARGLSLSLDGWLVSIRVPSAQTKNVKFDPPPFATRVYPPFWSGSPKYFVEKIGEREAMVRQDECISPR